MACNLSDQREDDPLFSPNLIGSRLCVSFELLDTLGADLVHDPTKLFNLLAKPLELFFRDAVML